MASKRLQLHLPATYRIQVQGIIDPTWSNQLGGMDISIMMCGYGDSSQTELKGTLLDQSALFGVLSTLYELRLPLISVTLVDLIDKGSGLMEGPS